MIKNNIPDQLNLTKIAAFLITACDGDGRVKASAFYRSNLIASIDAKGASDYEKDGYVTPVEVFTDGKNIYEIQLAGTGIFIDDDEVAYKAKVIEGIRAKLSNEEAIILGLSEPITK